MFCECGCGGEVKLGCVFSKGHNSRLPEVRNKISKSNIGHKVSEDTRRKISEKQRKRMENKIERDRISKSLKDKLIGEKNPFYGKKHTSETRKKISECRLGNKNPMYGRCGSKNPMYGRGGDLHPQWKGGISFIPYCPKFNERFKEKIRGRDNRTCQLCGVKENGRKLSVHHIHYDKENCYPDLITLCQKCNLEVNSNRDYFESLFMSKLQSRGLMYWRI